MQTLGAPLYRLNSQKKKNKVRQQITIQTIKAFLLLFSVPYKLFKINNKNICFRKCYEECRDC